MENEKWLIDANAFKSDIQKMFVPYGDGTNPGDKDAMIYDEALVDVLEAFNKAPAVDAVEVPDKKLLKAINLLIDQYEHSKRSDYVHNPIAHAFFHTWKQLDESGYGERKDNG